MKKGMDKTLESFRQEWKRPEENVTTFSWYEVCLKLRLFDILEKAPERSTVLENLTTMLTNEASIRMRKPSEVTLSGLAKMPEARPMFGTKTSFTELEDARARPVMDDPNSMSQISLSRNNVQSSSTSGSRQRKTIMEDSHMMNAAVRIQSKYDKNKKKFEFNSNKDRPSVENWIPETTRMQSIGRDIAVAKDNLGDIIKRETQSDREMRQFKTSVFEKALVEESLGSKKKLECGCCMLKFSYVNLPLKVSNKAVVDLRKQWSGGKRGWWSARDEKLGQMPRCYNDTAVCTFCAQFFVEQDRYRPSMEKIEYEQRRAAYFEAKRKEKERNDPLKMLEKDQAMQAAQEEEQMRMESQSDAGIVSLASSAPDT